MGKFAAFCKGATMGAFLLLLLAAGPVLGQDAFMPLQGGTELNEKRNGASLPGPFTGEDQLSICANAFVPPEVLP